MIRKVVALTLALAVAHFASLTLENAGVVRAIASPTAPETTTSPGKPVLQDTFDDNAAGAMWTVLAEDPSCRNMKEVNRRLEPQAWRLSDGAWAGYVANGWRLNPRHDFSAKVDYHDDLVSEADGWVSLGVTANPTSPWEDNAVVGVGCADGFSHYGYRRQTGSCVNTSFSQRLPTSGTLYVFYGAGVATIDRGLSAL